jgi:hypothetical protein
VNTKSGSVKKAVLTTVGVIAMLWLAGCMAIYGVMRQPPERFGLAMSKIPGPVAFLVFPFETMWKQARAGTLQIGDHAPDFALAKLDKSDRVQLSSLTAQGRPVVLVFGSYT